MRRLTTFYEAETPKVGENANMHGLTPNSSSADADADTNLVMLKIRSARLEDASAMLDVHREAVFTKAGSHYSQARLEEWSPGMTPDRLDRMRNEISDANIIAIVAEIGAELIAYSMVKLEESELRAIYVRPNPTGGVGKMLLAEMEKRARAEGIESLVCDASLNAVEFYKMNGYISEGSVDHALISGGTAPCVRMRKPKL